LQEPEDDMFLFHVENEVEWIHCNLPSWYYRVEILSTRVGGLLVCTDNYLKSHCGPDEGGADW
jgi:hypothetical protein